METSSRTRHRRFGRLFGGVAVVVLALSIAPAVTVQVPAAAAQPSVPDEAPDEASASVAAKQGNKSVLVRSKTDETTEVRANPNGSFTWKQSMRPVRVNRGGRWIPVDTTLARQPDGRILPAATLVDLELSAGGKPAAGVPLVRAAKDGAEVGLGWDGDLPEPTLSGATATYANVLPGVDLVVTADVVGFSEVLVVKTPEAARNPRLKKIAFGSHAKGLAVAATQKGALTAADPSGSVVFTGDASRMWDSSGDGPETDRLRGTADGARRAMMAVEATASAVSISPDQTFLADKNTAYPVYLDPSYRCTSCGKAHHNVVQSAFSNAHNFDRTDGALGDLKAGWVCETGDCPLISRTFLRMNTWALAGKVIYGANLHVEVINSFNCGGATPTHLSLVNWMDESTTWGTQPGGGTNPGVGMWLGTGNVTNNARHCPGASGMDLDALGGIQAAAANGWGETTFMLSGDSESNSSSWRRFDLNPYLVVDYNSKPNVPAALGVEGFGPNPGDALPCVLGAGRPFIPTRTPRLRAIISDPDGGIMDAGFRMLKGPKDSNPWDGNQTYINNIPSGSFAEVSIPSGVIPTDGVYNWIMWGGDGSELTWSPWCEFEVDTVKPGNPKVKSDQYPDGMPGGGVGQTGTFSITASTATTDTAYYLYSLTEQGGVPATKLTPSTVNGPVSVQWTPTLSGPQTLRVVAVDRAGNRSDPVDYRIVVSDFRVGISGKVAQWSLEDSLADTAGAKSLTYQGPPFGPVYGQGNQGQDVVLDPGNTEFYRAKDALIRTDTSFSVSAWVRLARDDNYYTFLSQDGTRMSGFYLQYNDQFDRWAMVLVDKDDESSTGRYRALSTSPPTLNTWTHLTGVFDAPARKLRLYVNGVKNGDVDVPTTAWNASGLFIVGAGKAAGARAQYFAGDIDSVRVHARALTDAEADALYRGTSTANPTAEYLFENNLANTGATNDLGQPAAGLGFGPGYAGRELRVNTTTGPLALTSTPLVNTTGSYSVSAWVKLVDKSNYYVIASQDGNRRAAFLMRYSQDSDRWIFGMPTSDADTGTMQWATGQSVPQAGVWTHLAGVHDAGSHKLLLYVNGMLEAQRDLTSVPSEVGQFVLGAEKSQGNRIGAFKGSLDEVNVYDGALSTAEVAALANVPVERTRYLLNETGGTIANDSVGGAPASLYGNGITWGQNNGAASASFPGNSTENAGTVPGTGPLARWDLNNRLTEASGNGRDLVHVNNSGSTAATYTGGRINEGVKLNGTDQRMQTAAAVLDTSRSYSVAAWVKLDRADGGWYTIAAQDGTTVSPFYLQYSGGLDRWTFSLTPEDRLDPGAYRAASTLKPVTGVWTQLVGVYDAPAGRARLYVNGQLEGDVAVTPGWRATGSFTIGRAKWSGNPVDFFPGTIDEVRVYDRALAATDANGLWNLGSNVVAPRPANFRTDRSFVLSAWVRPGGFDALSRQVVAVDANLSASITIGYRAEWRRWAVLAMVGTEAAPDGRWVLSDNEAGTYADANGWVHLAVLYDAPARKVKLYVNGSPQSTVPTGPTTVAKVDYAGADITLWDNGRGLLIGRTAWLGQAVDYWKGAIREVRVFTGVLPEFCDNAPNCMSQLPWQ